MSRPYTDHDTLNFKETLLWLVDHMGKPMVVHLCLNRAHIPTATMAGFLVGAEDIASPEDGPSLLTGTVWDGAMAFRLALDDQQDPAEAHCRFMVTPHEFEHSRWINTPPDPYMQILLGGYKLEIHTESGFIVEE